MSESACLRDREREEMDRANVGVRLKGKIKQ